ncbi:hypothetical protein ES703_102382 [subsurface metagenome]
MVIDFHTHVFPPRIRENRSQYADNDPSFALLYSGEKAKLATAEELIASMDRDGVEISVIVNYGWTTHELCVATNDYIMESLARHPKRLIGFCAVQLQSLEAAITEIERCARGGIRGVGELRPDLQLTDFPDENALQPLVKVLQKHNLMLMIHASEPVGHLYPGKGNFTPDRLYPFITSFPDLTIICAHWGGGLPFYALMPEVKKAMRNVYFDTAASSFLYNPQIYHQVSQLVGADKILFGSDYPLIPQSRYIQEINSTDLPEEEKDLILSGNARRLLGIKA